MQKIQTRGGPSKIEAILHSAGYSTNEIVSDSPSRFYEAWTTPPTNYVGTALFLGYIAAALYLIYFIVLRDILPRWSTDKISSRVKLLTRLTILSFSVLSFNMVSFLLDSLNRYHEHTGIENGPMTGSGTFATQLWSWMLNTSLFYDFAHNLLANDNVLYWTRQGLVMTLIIGFDMAIKGKGNKVKSLWSYFLLAQILPPTFSWLLLQLRIALSHPEPRPSTTPPQPDRETSLTIFASALAIASTSATLQSTLQLGNITPNPEVYSPELIWKVLYLRFLLLLPLFFNPEYLFVRNSLVLVPPCMLLVLSQSTTIGAWLQGGMSWQGLVEFRQAAVQNWAVSTLSCDTILWMFELFALKLGQRTAMP